MKQIISPGGQTIAINREFDEIFGGYAHLFCFDFELMKILLENGVLVILKNVNREIQK